MKVIVRYGTVCGAGSSVFDVKMQWITQIYVVLGDGRSDDGVENTSPDKPLLTPLLLP